MQYSDLSTVANSGALQRLVDEPLPAFDALRLRKVLKAVREEFQTFVEVRNEKIEEYGEDGQIDPDSDDWEDFNDEMQEVMEKEADVEIEPVSLEDLPDDLEISASDLDVLMEAGVIVADDA